MKTSVLSLALGVVLASPVVAYGSENANLIEDLFYGSDHSHQTTIMRQSSRIARPVQTQHNRLAELQPKRLRQLRLCRRPRRRPDLNGRFRARPDKRAASPNVLLSGNPEISAETPRRAVAGSRRNIRPPARPVSVAELSVVSAISECRLSQHQPNGDIHGYAFQFISPQAARRRRRRNVVTAASAASAASFGNPDQPAEGAVNAINPKALTDPGPQDPDLAGNEPAFLNPPATDVNGMPQFWSSFNLVPKRIQNGGWARQITQDDFKISTTIAGVNMRLGPGGVRELHWHQQAEWAVVTSGTAASPSWTRMDVLR